MKKQSLSTTIKFTIQHIAQHMTVETSEFSKIKPSGKAKRRERRAKERKS